MSHSLFPRTPGSGSLRAYRRFRLRSVRFVLECLETRQLLSVASPALDQIVALPSLTATPLIYNSTPSGLSPSQVRQAYGLNSVSFQGGAIAGNGGGQTIAIVSAYDDPTIGSDLKQFDSQFGLPNAPSFIKYYQPGVTQRNSGWALETALDVEWAHAMAPGANLVLVEARTASFSDLFNAVNFARSLSGVVAVSMSWGAGEFSGETAYDSLFTTPAGHIGGNGLPGGITFVAASGDGGAWAGVSYPAASPNVLSVGATTLNLGAGGSNSSESGWTYSTGGFSALEPAPAYQVGTQLASGLSYGLRTVPDVSAVGDPATGVSIYDSFSYGGHSGWFTVGGTSASAPQWAGLIAVADQGLALAGKGSLGNAQSALYAISSSAFHDVTSGFNGYSAKSGYNLVGGLGTPVASQLVAGLLGTQGVSNVNGFTSRIVPRVAFSHTAQAIFVLGTDGAQGSSNGSGSTTTTGASGTTSLFPVVTSNPVVIIVPVGPSRVVIILPPVMHPTTRLSANNHLVEPLLASTTSSMANLALSPYSKFGQGGIVDSLTMIRKTRFGDEMEVASLIDLIEPFQPPAPNALPKADADLRGRQAGAMPTAWALPFLPRLEHEEALDGTAQGRAGAGEVGPLAQTLRDGPNDESHGTGSASRLAAAAALAGAGLWITLRETDRREAWHRRGRSAEALKPPLRRFSLPPR